MQRDAAAIARVVQLRERRLAEHVAGEVERLQPRQRAFLESVCEGAEAHGTDLVVEQQVERPNQRVTGAQY